jgi:drug/metabolite transporter (DMT)-like permease
LKSNYKAHSAILIANIFFAITFSAAKTLFNENLIKPFGLNLIRVFTTAALLWVMYLFSNNKQTIQKKDLRRFALCALTGVAVNQLLFIKGLSLTYSIHASLLMLTTPILITIIAAWLLKERLTKFKIIGLVLGVLGALVLILSKNNTGNANDVFVGDIIILLNAISYTFYFILVRPLIKNYNPIMVMRIIFTIGFFMMLPFCYTEFMATDINQYGAREIAILATIVFGGTFIAYLFNIYGIQVLGPSITGAYIYTQPVFAAVIAIAILGETITLYKIIAALFIFAGVYLANKKTSNA